MVEKQMRSSILAVGSFWYSAWIDAGQPDLKNLNRKTPEDETAKSETAFEKRKTTIREEE
jgi:hypothetical protein